MIKGSDSFIAYKAALILIAVDKGDNSQHGDVLLFPANNDISSTFCGEWMSLQ
jgi:hypothetical protein